MSDGQPRVRVTGPPRRTSTRRPLAADIDSDTALGGVYLDSLLRAQFALALRTMLVLAIGVGSLPLLFVLFPDLAGVRLAGLPLSWLLLGVAVYPFLVLLGWRYVRKAEVNEAAFAELLARETPDEELEG